VNEDEESMALGKLNFERYAEAMEGVTHGRGIPPWPELGEKVQRAWALAAEAVRDNS
jgi:hypothetical protein